MHSAKHIFSASLFDISPQVRGPESGDTEKANWLYSERARVCRRGDLCARDVTHLFDLLFCTCTGRPAGEKYVFCAHEHQQLIRASGRFTEEEEAAAASLILSLNKFLERFHPYLLPPINTWTAAAAWLFLSKTHKALYLHLSFFLSPTRLTQNAYATHAHRPDTPLHAAHPDVIVCVDWLQKMTAGKDFYVHRLFPLRRRGVKMRNYLHEETLFCWFITLKGALWNLLSAFWQALKARPLIIVVKKKYFLCLLDNRMVW